MGELTYEHLLKMYSAEVLSLCSINDRFDNEPVTVRDLRASYANTFMHLTHLRDEAGRSEAGRNYNISITELENSCMRAIKGVYSK